MCGIFGLSVKNSSKVDSQFVLDTITKLFIESESRGKEASGLAIRTNKSIYLLKGNVRAKDFVRAKEFRTIIQEAHSETCKNDSSLTILGHSRLVTNGAEEEEENNQPITFGDVMCVHNGIVVNDAELWKELGALGRETAIDTEVVTAFINHYRKEQSLEISVDLTMSKIEGAATIAVLCQDAAEFCLATNTGSLYYCENSNNGLIFASEKFILKKIDKNKVAHFFSMNNINRLEAGSVILRECEGLDAAAMQSSMPYQQEEGWVQDKTPFVHLKSITKKLKGLRPPTLSTVKGKLVSKKISRAFEERVAEVSFLKRCTNCVLPETMPFITFDENGACNYCNSYTPIEVRGREALAQLANDFRSRNGSPDCIVAISGGRDSTYGLHYIKNQLQMNPIAYTYDWGMVTDLARRNQSRITGKLGVEHIVVSADIQKKRENIAKNVRAWLRRPELGMVPLFMAGDKQFYYYANLVRKQTGVPLVFFSAGNEMEATGFKTGFCGIKRHSTGGLLASVPMAQKLALMFYYLKNFVVNPGYLTTALFDTAHAFFSTYLMEHDFHYLYHYLYWDEQEIMTVLEGEYDWQTASDTDATWRIGDGTAAFYNYIYFFLAGLTENDTFRSNQIREGRLSRAKALELIASENRPRYDTIQEYLDIIGLDFDSTLEIINAQKPIFR